MNILDKIIDVKKEEVKLLKKEFTRSSFESMEYFNKKCISLKDRLNNNNQLSIIAEIKKASPSKGILKKDFNHLLIAETYLQNEVDAISVLTDEHFFQGKLSYLADIAGISKKPLLRKDFIIDEYQILEAKANGADIILLISEALSKFQIKDLTQTATGLGLEVLLEMHSADQIDKIDFDLNKVIGINNRDLNNFNVDLNTTIEIKKLLPENIFVISESGISQQQDISFLKSKNINGILVGEHLMRSINLTDNIKQLKSWCQDEN